MTDMPASGGAFELQSERMGCLPVVDHFFGCIDLDGRLGRFLPKNDRRLRLAPGKVAALLVRNIVVHHRALYAIGEWAARLQPALLGLGEGDAAFLNDDRVGRALDRLFDCDRASLLTETVLEAVRVFAIDCSELHNDSTTVTVTGQRLREGRTPGPWRQESTHRHLRPQQGFPPDTATARLRAHGLLRRRGAGRGEDL